MANAQKLFMRLLCSWLTYFVAFNAIFSPYTIDPCILSLFLNTPFIFAVPSMLEIFRHGIRQRNYQKGIKNP